MEKAVLTVMGPNHVVWNVGELSRKLVDNGIRDVMDLPKLKNFLSKRPALFTLMGNHVWSKLESIKDLQETEVKTTSSSTIAVPERDSELVDKALVKKILGLMSSRGEYGESWNINQLLNMMKHEVVGFDKLKFEQRPFTSFLRNRPDYFKIQDNGQHVQVAISYTDHIQMEKYFQEYKETHPTVAKNDNIEEVKSDNPWNKNKKHFDEAKENKRPYGGLTKKPEPSNGFVFPQNALLNPIANLMNNCPHTIENSTRITVASRTAIMFKTQWVYDHLPSHSTRAWRTSRDLTKELEKDPDFYSGSQSCQLKEIIAKSPHPDLIARTILDLLLSSKKESITAQEIFNQVPAKIKAFLKTLKGARGFVQFYPALFVLEGDEVKVQHEPIFKQDLNLPKLPNPPSVSDYDQKALNSVVTLMTMSHAMPSNALVFVIENLDKIYLSIDWVHDRLPKNIKERFKHPNHLYGFFMKFKGTFVLLGKFVQLKSTLRNLPCDKSTSLEIVKLQSKKGDMSTRELYTGLPDSCRTRIRSESELKKFLKLYCDFHYDIDNLGEIVKVPNSKIVSNNALIQRPSSTTAATKLKSEKESTNHMVQLQTDMSLPRGSSPLLPDGDRPFTACTWPSSTNSSDFHVQDRQHVTEEFYELFPMDGSRKTDTILEL